MKKIIIIGPAHPLRGGIAHFNDRLARAFIAEGHDTSIYSFSLQYPGFLFPGTSQFSDGPAPEGIRINTCINSVNPLNWLKVGRKIRNEKPDLVVVRFWLPFMGPCLGTILRIIHKNKHTRIVCLADNIIPHEKRPGDHAFTRYFLKACDAVVTMSDKVLADLRTFDADKPALKTVHPLYDDFGAPMPRNEAREKLNLPQQESLLLFFGFIRKYKGLDLLLEALKLLKDKGARYTLLIAGEFYGENQANQDQIDALGIRDQLILRTEFIPDNEVRFYLSAADVVVQPYRNATQSGVTPLAYHFNKPMIVTNVGGLAELVPHKKAGIVTEPDPEAIALGIEEFFTIGGPAFEAGLAEEKLKYSWRGMTNALTSV